MGIWSSYKLRLKRRHHLYSAFRKRRELQSVFDRTTKIRPNDILAFTTLRNECIRLPYFLNYYRDLGVNHFLMIDNGSDDGSKEYLSQQGDVSLWTTDASYKDSNFGVNWTGWLQRKYAHDHWSLVVDPDEFLIYPFCDTRPLNALTDWLDSAQIRSFGAMLLDMYPKGPMNAYPYQSGQNPFEIANWFDSSNYMISKNPVLKNLWIQGGPRARAFFSDAPKNAPALNKIPLVKWHKSYSYISSTHTMLPRGLNLVYDEWGGEKASGCLLHAKFLNTFGGKSAEEIARGQHYANSAEYKAYHEGGKNGIDLWFEWSEKYRGWRQIEKLGLMSKGNWA